MDLVRRLWHPSPLCCATFGMRGEDPPHLPGWRLYGIQGGRLMSIGSTGGSRLDVARRTQLANAGTILLPAYSHSPRGSVFCKSSPTQSPP